MEKCATAGLSSSPYLRSVLLGKPAVAHDIAPIWACIYLGDDFVDDFAAELA